MSGLRNITRQTASAGLSDKADVAADEARHRALTAELNTLRERRMRHTLALERATAEEQACQREAQGMGIASLEELDAYIARTAREDKERLDAFEKALREEAALLDAVDAAVAAVDAQA